jgi:hypothetical protein
MREFFFPFFSKLPEHEKFKIIRAALIFTIFCSLILGYFTLMLHNDLARNDTRWNAHLYTDQKIQPDLDVLSKNATKVLCGTYLEGIHDIDMAHGGFWANYLVWFRWEGNEITDMADHFRVYRGYVKQKDIVKNITQGNLHYQIVRMEVVVDSNFATKLFPLDSQQFFFYLEPFYTGKKVVFVADTKESNVNPYLDIDGYKMVKHATTVFTHEYKYTRADPELENATDKNIVTELATGIKVQRNGFGLFAKCFIALYGCIIWALMTLFINIYHHVDPLEMLPECLFGCVANIMVGASLLPDVLEMGLLEYVNIWGILLILSTTFVVINVNEIRRKESNPDGTCYHAAAFGRIMFYLITFFAIFGNFILPYSALY